MPDTIRTGPQPLDKPLAVELKGVWFSYERTPVLTDVSFSLRQGDFLGIIGPNGGGKTTLLKIMLGLLKPDRGSVRILGDTPLEARHRVGYVPQTTSLNISFPVSALEIALMGRLSLARPGRPYSRRDRDKVEELLRRVGMWELRDRAVGTLSGGQRQRVLIARALATDPEILFLDEPATGVDREFETDLFRLLEDLNQEATIVVITHDIGVISRSVRSVACVNRRLIFHEGGQITKEMIDMAYACPVDLVAHGLPHRVLERHDEG